MVKCFVGDRYLIEKVLSPLIKDKKDDTMNFMYSSNFGTNELYFISSFSFTDKRVLVYSTDTLEKNDMLLDLLQEPLETADIYIICRNIVKGRKLYKKLNELKAIEFYKLNTSSIRNLCVETANAYNSRICSDDITYIINRLGFNSGNDNLSGDDISGYIKQLAVLSNPINRDNIDNIIPKYMPDNIWTMKSAFMKGQTSIVIQMADTIMAQKNSSAIAILSAMIVDIRRLYKLSFFPDRQEEVLKAMGVKSKPYTGKQYTTLQLGKCLSILIEGVLSCKKCCVDQTLQLKIILTKCLAILNEEED